MVSLSGQLVDGGSPNFFILFVRDQLGRDLTVGIELSPQTISSPRTKVRLASLPGTYTHTPSGIKGSYVARWRELPSHVVGFLYYTDKACFSTGLSVSASYISLPSDNYVQSGLVLPPKRRRAASR